jgi:hypothetical protein
MGPEILADCRKAAAGMRQEEANDAELMIEAIPA